MANNYAYSDITGKKIKVPNAVKIALYAVCLIPILNVAFMVVLLTGISFIEFEWKGWEENKFYIGYLRNENVFVLYNADSYMGLFIKIVETGFPHTQAGWRQIGMKTLRITVME